MFVDNGDVVTGGAHDDRFQVITEDGNDAVKITDFTAPVEGESDGDTLYIRDNSGGYVIQERISTALTEDGEDTNVMLDGNVVATLLGVTELAEGAIDNPDAPQLYGTREIAADEEEGIEYADGADTLEIGVFEDSVIGYSGDDTISFAPGIDTAGRDMAVQAGSGDDTVTLGLGDDSVMGSLGDYVIIGGGGSDEIYGGYGNDTLNSAGPAGDAADTVFGGAGDDVFYADGGDALIGEDGVDEFNVDLTEAGSDAVAIDDFDPTMEQLNVEVSLALDAAPTVTYEEAAGGSGTNVIVDGSVAIFLVGLDPSALAGADINITNTNVTP